MHDFAATESFVRPYAYLLPPSFEDAAANLRRHRIDVQELREDIELDVKVSRVDEVGGPASSGWDRRNVVELRVNRVKSQGACRPDPPGQDGATAWQSRRLLARAPLRRWPGHLEISSTEL